MERRINTSLLTLAIIERFNDVKTGKLKLASEAGIGPRTMERMLNGYVPREPTLRLMAIILGYDVDLLFPRKAA